MNLPVASITRAVASRSLWSSRPSWFQPPGHWPSEFPHLVAEEFSMARVWLDTALKLTAGNPTWWFGGKVLPALNMAIFGIYLKFLGGMVWLKHSSEILLTSWGWWFIPWFTGCFLNPRWLFGIPEPSTVAPKYGSFQVRNLLFLGSIFRGYDVSFREGRKKKLLTRICWRLRNHQILHHLGTPNDFGQAKGFWGNSYSYKL